jgi:hypothetical protein
VDGGVDGTADHLVSLVDAACAEGYDGTGELTAVARGRPDLLRPYHRRLLDADVWWPEDLYRGMDEATAGYVLALIDSGAPRPDKLLGLLAAGATDTAVRAMWRWEHQPPAWAAELHLPVRDYAQIGGWEFDPAGTVRRLTSAVAFALVPDGSATPVVSGGALASRCGWCDLPLWRLLDVYLSGGILPDLAGPETGRVVVATCLRCGRYTTAVFTEYDETGRCRWVGDQQRPDFLGPEDQTWDLPTAPGLRIGAPRPTPFAGDAWVAGGSTFGGSPDWGIDAWYPPCPRCGRTMRYLGMITGPDLWAGPAEGCHYVFFDARCRLGAAVYDQS